MDALVTRGCRRAGEKRSANGGRGGKKTRTAYLPDRWARPTTNRLAQSFAAANLRNDELQAELQRRKQNIGRTNIRFGTKHGRKPCFWGAAAKAEMAFGGDPGGKDEKWSENTFQAK